MIKVTEIHEVESIGDVLREVEYPKFNNYTLHSDGSLGIWRTDSEKTTLEEVLYIKGSFTKVHKS